MTRGKEKKSKLSYNRRGFTFSEKKTEIGDKKKGGKKGEPVTFGLTTFVKTMTLRLLMLHMTAALKGKMLKLPKLQDCLL